MSDRQPPSMGDRSMGDRQPSSIDPIVLDSGDRIGQSSVGERVSSGHDTSARKPSGGGWFWKVLLLILLVGFGGLGYFFVQEMDKLATLQARFDELQAKIASTDESLAQSGTSLSLKINEHQASLDKHWSEIKKLWGISNDKNRKAIAAQAAAIKAARTELKKEQSKLQSAISAVKTSVKNRQKELATLTGELGNAEKSAEKAASSALAVKLDVDDLTSKLDALSGQLTRTDERLQVSHDKLTQRIVAQEKTIKTLDSNRILINRQLQKLQKKLAAAQASAPVPLAP